MYIYIYIYTYTCICIYLSIYMHYDHMCIYLYIIFIYIYTIIIIQQNWMIRSPPKHPSPPEPHLWEEPPCRHSWWPSGWDPVASALEAGSWPGRRQSRPPSGHRGVTADANWWDPMVTYGWSIWFRHVLEVVYSWVRFGSKWSSEHIWTSVWSPWLVGMVKLSGVWCRKVLWRLPAIHLALQPKAISGDWNGVITVVCKGKKRSWSGHGKCLSWLKSKGC